MSNRSVNKVILIGNLGQDPEIRQTSNGSVVANFSVATSENWKDKKTGEVKENTEWHRVVIFGKLAEIAGQYLRKGVSVYLEGQLRTRKWQNQNGQDRLTTEVLIGLNGTMQILSPKLTQETQKNQNTTSLKSTEQTNKNKSEELFENFDEDIPF